MEAEGVDGSFKKLGRGSQERKGLEREGSRLEAEVFCTVRGESLSKAEGG